MKVSGTANGVETLANQTLFSSHLDFHLLLFSQRARRLDTNLLRNNART